jgi:hypothetical protein
MCRRTCAREDLVPAEVLREVWAIHFILVQFDPPEHVGRVAHQLRIGDLRRFDQREAGVWTKQKAAAWKSRARYQPTEEQNGTLPRAGALCLWRLTRHLSGVVLLLRVDRQYSECEVVEVQRLERLRRTASTTRSRGRRGGGGRRGHAGESGTGAEYPRGVHCSVPGGLVWCVRSHVASSSRRAPLLRGVASRREAARGRSSSPAEGAEAMNGVGRASDAETAYA